MAPVGSLQAGGGAVRHAGARGVAAEAPWLTGEQHHERDEGHGHALRGLQRPASVGEGDHHVAEEDVSEDDGDPEDEEVLGTGSQPHHEVEHGLCGEGQDDGDGDVCDGGGQEEGGARVVAVRDVRVGDGAGCHGACHLWHVAHGATHEGCEEVAQCEATCRSATQCETGGAAAGTVAPFMKVP